MDEKQIGMIGERVATIEAKVDNIEASQVRIEKMLSEHIKREMSQMEKNDIKYATKGEFKTLIGFVTALILSVVGAFVGSKL